MSAAKRGGLACLVLLACACGPAEDRVAGTAAPAGAEANAAAADGHSSRNALDWAGTYSGVIPCADCPGIRETVTLHADGRFERTLVYLERSVRPHVERGSFSWNAAGSRVTLRETGGAGQPFKVGENTLIHLDGDGNPITGELAGRYVLHKHLHDPGIEGRKWMLVELRGKPVDAGSGAPFLLLDAEKAIASGNTSCNSFSGGYAIKSGGRISFDEHPRVTMMACPGMAIEQQFLEALRDADSYTVGDGVLSLNRARMAPLARFELPEQSGEPGGGT